MEALSKLGTMVPTVHPGNTHRSVNDADIVSSAHVASIHANAEQPAVRATVFRRRGRGTAERTTDGLNETLWVGERDGGRELPGAALRICNLNSGG